MPSKQHSARVTLQDIRENISFAAYICEGLTYESFRADKLRVYGLTRCFEIISEASRCLPLDIKERHPQIEWHAIAAAGNVYRHNYEKLIAGYLWRTLQVEIPCLLLVVESELALLSPQP